MGGRGMNRNNGGGGEGQAAEGWLDNFRDDGWSADHRSFFRFNDAGAPADGVHFLNALHRNAGSRPHTHNHMMVEAL